MDTVAPSSAAMTARHIDQESLGGKLRGLLERALEDDTSSSRSDLFHHLLDGLVPDEARILGALSDGSASPMIHIFQRTRGGSTGEAVLQNMSLIGKSANLTLPQMTPVYVGRLKLMGLVEEGPEDSRLKTEYEILAADTMVLRAIRRATHGPIPPRVEKRSLQLSPLGADLWRAALDDFR
ncbi:MAG: Abi-alpha family protein [Propionibacteriales bacterium]|nr:Abi-alpha family protein [Propionibacteriales bacterium]